MQASPDPTVTTYDKEGREFISIVETAYNRARLTPEEARRVNKTPGLYKSIAYLLAKNRDSHQIHSPTEYTGPKPINTQIEALAAIFNLNPASALQYAEKLPKLPHGAEGWFAVPSIDGLGNKYFPAVSDPAEKYCRAIQLVLDKIAASRTFRNWCDGQITPDHLLLSNTTREALAELAQTQSGDILIIAAQLGMRHRGCSVRRARALFTKREFGLGSVMGGSIALTHPERFVPEKLGMDLPGDEFNDETSNSRDCTPYLYCSHEDKITFGVGGYDHAMDHFGSSSGILPPK